MQPADWRIFPMTPTYPFELETPEEIKV